MLGTEWPRQRPFLLQQQYNKSIAHCATNRFCLVTTTHDNLKRGREGGRKQTNTLQIVNGLTFVDFCCFHVENVFVFFLAFLLLHFLTTRIYSGGYGIPQAFMLLCPHRHTTTLCTYPSVSSTIFKAVTYTTSAWVFACTFVYRRGGGGNTWAGTEWILFYCNLPKTAIDTFYTHLFRGQLPPREDCIRLRHQEHAKLQTTSCSTRPWEPKMLRLARNECLVPAEGCGTPDGEQKRFYRKEIHNVISTNVAPHPGSKNDLVDRHHAWMRPKSKRVPKCLVSPRPRDTIFSNLILLDNDGAHYTDSGVFVRRSRNLSVDLLFRQCRFLVLKIKILR